MLDSGGTRLALPKPGRRWLSRPSIDRRGTNLVPRAVLDVAERASDIQYFLLHVTVAVADDEVVTALDAFRGHVFGQLATQVIPKLAVLRELGLHQNTAAEARRKVEVDRSSAGLHLTLHHDVVGLAVVVGETVEV